MKFIFSADEAMLGQFVDEIDDKIDAAKQGAVKDVAELAVKEGRANIASAGFSARWQRGLRYNFYPNEDTGNPAALLFHRIGYAVVFERGMTIAGHPLLWLPLERNLPNGVHSPKQYGKELVSVNIAGKPPLLFDKFNRLRGPLFVGVSSVNIRKRFDLMRIFQAAADRVGEFYEQRIKG